VDEIKRELKERGIPIDSRSNGPAIIVYKLAGGKRPKRAESTKEWSIHHIYNGKFPFREGGKILHAVKEGKHFTQSAGLVAIHPIAEALADGCLGANPSRGLIMTLTWFSAKR